MNEDILNELFLCYADNCFKHFIPVTWSEIDPYSEKLKDFKKKHHLTYEEEEVLETDIIGQMIYVSERKGFINGLKLGARLAAQLLASNDAADKN